MMRFLIGSVGSMVWSTVVFAIGMTIFFPSDWVKDQISYQVQKQSKKKLLVSIGEASSAGLFGIALEDVSLFDSKRGKRQPGTSGTAPRENTLIGSLDAISLSPSILGLFTGKLAADMEVGLAGGDIETSFGIDTSSIFLGTDIQGFQLGAHPIDSEDVNVELSGMLNLVSDLTINRDEIKSSTGDISLTIDNLALKKATISGFDLEETAFSEAILEMSVEDGKAKVTKGSFVGDLIEATIEGHITLRKDLSRSRLSLKFLVRFDETLDKLAMMMLKSARDEDGVYHFKGQGTIMSPRFRAERVNRRSSGSRGTKSTDANDDRDNDDSIDRSSRSRRRSTSTDEERDERRAKRRERLKKRRERMKKRREDRREQSRDRADYGSEAVGRDQYDDDEPPDGTWAEPEEEEIPPVYNNDPQYQGNDQQYDDPNGNMEDLGYIDE